MCLKTATDVELKRKTAVVGRTCQTKNHGTRPTQQPVFRSAGDDDASDSDGCTSDFAETTSSHKQLQRKRPRSTARVLRSAGYHSSTAIGLQLKWRRVYDSENDITVCQKNGPIAFDRSLGLCLYCAHFGTHRVTESGATW